MRRKSGGKLNSRYTKLVVFPRGNGSYLNIKVQAIMSFKPFHLACPAPKPMTKMDKDGNKSAWTEEPRYQEALAKHNELFNAWVVLNSITSMEEITPPQEIDNPEKPGEKMLGPVVTEEFFFEGINPEDKDTWLNWINEMEEAGISQGERNRLIDAAMMVNSLTDDSVAEALSDFLAMVQAAAGKGVIQKDENSFTPSSAPVSDSSSSHPETKNAGAVDGTTSTQTPKNA